MENRSHSITHKSSLFRRSTYTASKLMRSRFWLWSVLAAVILVVSSSVAQVVLERQLTEEVREYLHVILDTVVEGQSRWYIDQKNDVTSIASDPRLIAPTTKLLQAISEKSLADKSYLANEAHQEIVEVIKPFQVVFDFISYAIVSPDKEIIASDDKYLIGLEITGNNLSRLERVLSGESVVTHPFLSLKLLTKGKPEGTPIDDMVRRHQHVMLAGAPIRDSEGKVIAIVSLRLDPHKIFTRFLDTAKIRDSGETYAFDKNGVMLSESRFEEELIDIGLVPEKGEYTSMLYLDIRDPGVDMTTGARPTQRRQDQPLTLMAKSATAGHTDSNVKGYRDYRGVEVVGAWKWIDEYEYGVATEMDYNEAYSSLIILRWVFRGLFLVVIVTSVIIGVVSFFVLRLQHSMEQVVTEFKQMGQYHLIEKIGHGGMGAVYRAQHSLMRRPTAIKILDPKKTSPSSISRFEREVQLTCRLTHPNTIGIYDYGRTPKGVFYYAMELIEGINLEDLVKRYGALPEGRVIYILLQVCGSLAEAHSIGLIHRDIKPANLMLSDRGGQPDMIKVLDFGLVKSIETEDEEHLTQESVILGTPLYMPPEEIETPEDVDYRGDIYSLGAVAYFMLTGQPPFTGKSVSEICMHQVETQPAPPSTKSMNSITREIERVILKCLEKDRAQRPRDMKELMTLLQKCSAASEWGYSDGEKWWAENVVIEQLEENDFLHMETSEERKESTIFEY